MEKPDLLVYIQKLQLSLEEEKSKAAQLNKEMVRCMRTYTVHTVQTPVHTLLLYIFVDL